MRIGTFLLILLVATVALGYLLSDSMHLREDLANQQQENQRLVQSLRQAEQEKQNVLTTLIGTSQELDSCRQAVEQSKSTIGQLTNENLSLKSRNHELEAALKSPIAQGSSPMTNPTTIDATSISFASFVTVSMVSAILVVLKYLQRSQLFKKGSKAGQYIFLTNAEIADLVMRRRGTIK